MLSVKSFTELTTNPETNLSSGFDYEVIVMRIADCSFVCLNKNMETGTKKVGKKRDRSENWLSEDKHLLKELVRERVSVIENKNTDTNTNSNKQKAWADLLNSFNCMCKGSKRTLAQLKSQWGISKMQQKRLKSAERKHIIATGGGPPPPPQQDTENSEDISAWLPNEFIIDTNEFDSDQINKVKIGEAPDELILEVNNQDDGITQKVLPVTNHDEINKLKKDENKNKVVSPLTNQLRKRKTGIKENENKVKQIFMSIKISASAANKIASIETDCRKELHKIQMENEQKKARNLDLKEVLMKKKIEYYEKKINALQ